VHRARDEDVRKVIFQFPVRWAHWPIYGDHELPTQITIYISIIGSLSDPHPVCVCSVYYQPNSSRRGGPLSRPPYVLGEGGVNASTSRGRNSKLEG
jgi:hypothetical protein